MLLFEGGEREREVAAEAEGEAGGEEEETKETGKEGGDSLSSHFLLPQGKRYRMATLSSSLMLGLSAVFLFFSYAPGTHPSYLSLIDFPRLFSVV